MEILMRDSGNKIKKMDLEIILVQMEINLKDIGKMIKLMEKENFSG